MKWISVEDDLPKHSETVLTYSAKGYDVAVFTDSIKLNILLRRTGMGNQSIDISEKPYIFANQDIGRFIIDNVTHWLPLPDKPIGECKYDNLLDDGDVRGI